MEQINVNSSVSAVDDDKDDENKETTVLRNSNKDTPNVESYKSVIDAIDNQKLHEIENLFKDSNKSNKNDIIIEMYNNKLLNSERLQFLIKYCTDYFKVPSKLIKKLIKDENVDLLDIIYNNLKFFDNEFILQLLIYYKNKKVISTSELNQQISNEKYRILVNSNLPDSQTVISIKI